MLQRRNSWESRAPREPPDRTCLAYSPMVIQPKDDEKVSRTYLREVAFAMSNRPLTAKIINVRLQNRNSKFPRDRRLDIAKVSFSLKGTKIWKIYKLSETVTTKLTIFSFSFFIFNFFEDVEDFMYFFIINFFWARCLWRIKILTAFQHSNCAPQENWILLVSMKVIRFCLKIRLIWLL